MGIKGFIRTVGAAQRQAERAARRRQRELERQQKEYNRMQELAQASYEVECYENKIDLLLSVHKECESTMNWEKIKMSSPPPRPSMNNINENTARGNLDDFKPGLFTKLFGQVEKKQDKLKQAVEDAKAKDENDYRNAIKEYEENLTNWKETHALAEKICAGDTGAYCQAIKEINPFSEISQLGSSVKFSVISASIIEVVLKPNGNQVIPSETKSLLKSGKLSVKKMPKGKFFELYQDYVCGCILRVAREVFALLPANMVIVHATGDVLNSKTGHIEEKAILSAAIPKTTLCRFNFESVDPSDSMENFVHKMNFKKTKGFEPVEKLDPKKFQ